MSWIPEEYDDLKNGDISLNTCDNTTQIILHKIFVARASGGRDPYSRHCTFLIPFAADSIERISSIHLNILNILTNTDSKILICIADVPDRDYKNYLFPPILSQFGYSETLADELADRVLIIERPRKHNDPFDRMRYLNDLLEIAETPVVANLDSDVLISSATIRYITQQLLLSSADVIYPSQFGYGGCKRVWSPNFLEHCWGTPVEEIDKLVPFHIDSDQAKEPYLVWRHQSNPRIENTALAFKRVIAEDNFALIDTGVNLPPPIPPNTPGLFSKIAHSGFGHVIFVSREKYISAYGENEEFVSWGAEDVERFIRFKKLGLHIARAHFIVYHLEHPRGVDSSNNNPRFDSNTRLWNKLQKMSAKELLAYYESTDYVDKRNWKQPQKMLTWSS